MGERELFDDSSEYLQADFAFTKCQLKALQGELEKAQVNCDLNNSSVSPSLTTSSDHQSDLIEKKKGNNWGRIPLFGSGIDLREKKILGRNWYYAEDDGRWTGPDRTSTLRLPVVSPSRYNLRLCVVDAMDYSLLKDMVVSLNGRALSLSEEKKSKWSFNKNSYPKIFSSTLISDEYFDVNNDLDYLVLKIELPKVLSPSEVGFDDQDLRQLGIRVKFVSLLPV